MSHKNIETSREIRLWVGLAASVITTVTVLAMNPQVQDKVYEAKIKGKRFVNNVGRKIRNFKDAHSKKITIEKEKP